mmetsp:Transcript_26671/g.40459  ORF Transcript_26671/g.40459 Transcript_26671/m.40459 type:complete len:273 (+) Transcript_26671:491-1309(+)
MIVFSGSGSLAATATVLALASSHHVLAAELAAALAHVPALSTSEAPSTALVEALTLWGHRWREGHIFSETLAAASFAHATTTLPWGRHVPAFAEATLALSHVLPSVPAATASPALLHALHHHAATAHGLAAALALAFGWHATAHACALAAHAIDRLLAINPLSVHDRHSVHGVGHDSCSCLGIGEGDEGEAFAETVFTELEVHVGNLAIEAQEGAERLLGAGLGQGANEDLARPGGALSTTPRIVHRRLCLEGRLGGKRFGVWTGHTKPVGS